ncbi:hypothetical protein KCP74_10220 [Salmonella enterica subsp. enterica]|nr:hypothetical protein KCP74_10220 [Salmonella enterica subsp. enterica]
MSAHAGATSDGTPRPAAPAGSHRCAAGKPRSPVRANSLAARSAGCLLTTFAATATTALALPSGCHRQILCRRSRRRASASRRLPRGLTETLHAPVMNNLHRVTSTPNEVRVRPRDHPRLPPKFRC